MFGPRQDLEEDSIDTEASQERRSLLPSDPGLAELDQKQLFRLAGVPKFPGEDDEPFPKPLSYVDFGDLSDEICPTCLELYTADDPKITLKCGHHFHLGCIYEWLERANTCPVCFRPMQFDELK